jgi:hypothetical protein
MRTLEFIRDETIRTDIPVETHLSPSGKYRLVVTCHATTKGGWSYSHGLVYEGERVIGDIHRNYPDWNTGERNFVLCPRENKINWH